MREWLKKRLKHGLLVSGERPEGSNIIESLYIADNPPIAREPEFAEDGRSSPMDISSWANNARYDLDYLFHSLNEELLSLYLNDKVIFHELDSLDGHIRKLHLIAKEKEIDSTNKTVGASCWLFSDPDITDFRHSEVYTLPNGSSIQLPFVLSNNAIDFDISSKMLLGAGIISDTGDKGSGILFHNVWARTVITESPATIKYRITCTLKSAARQLSLSCVAMFGSKIEILSEYKGVITYPEQGSIGRDIVANIFSLAEKIHIDISNPTVYLNQENICTIGFSRLYISNQEYEERATWTSKNLIKEPVFARSVRFDVNGVNLDSTTFALVAKDTSDNELFIRPGDTLSFNRSQPIISEVRWRSRLNIDKLWFDTIKLQDIALSSLIMAPAILRFKYSSYTYPYQKHHPSINDWYNLPPGVSVFERRFSFHIMTWPNDPNPSGDIVLRDKNLDNHNVKATFYVYPMGLSSLDIDTYIYCKNVRGQIYLNGNSILSVNAGSIKEEIRVRLSLVPGQFNKIDLVGYRWNLGYATDRSATNATVVNLQNLCKEFLKHLISYEQGFLKLVPYDDVLFARRNLSANHAGIRRRGAGTYDLVFYRNVYPLAMAYESVAESYVTDMRLVARLKRTSSDWTPVLQDFSVTLNA